MHLLAGTDPNLRNIYITRHISTVRDQHRSVKGGLAHGSGDLSVLPFWIRSERTEGTARLALVTRDPRLGFEYYEECFFC